MCVVWYSDENGVVQSVAPLTKKENMPRSIKQKMKTKENETKTGYLRQVAGYAGSSLEHDNKTPHPTMKTKVRYKYDHVPST